MLWVFAQERFVKEQVVVPEYHDLMLVGLRGEPRKLSLDLIESTLFGQISGVDKQVTWREHGAKVVRVGDADDFH
ncbi:hypothetical protein LTR95_013869 [Oleoguttula sp. CCFEE 5521]